MTTETNLIVRYAETDQMGIVHHSVYAVWFEAARTDFLHQANMSYNSIEKAGFFLPVIDLNCHFIKPAHYEDEVIVKTTISKMTCVKMVFDYEVINKASGELLVTGSTTHAFTDKTPRAVNMIKKDKALYDILSKLMN